MHSDLAAANESLLYLGFFRLFALALPLLLLDLPVQEFLIYL